jgi:Na+/H+ antiporter NhaB
MMTEKTTPAKRGKKSLLFVVFSLIFMAWSVIQFFAEIAIDYAWYPLIISFLLAIIGVKIGFSDAQNRESWATCGVVLGISIIIIGILFAILILVFEYKVLG